MKLRELIATWRERVADGYLTGNREIDAVTTTDEAAYLNCATQLEEAIEENELIAELESLLVKWAARTAASRNSHRGGRPVCEQELRAILTKHKGETS